MRQSMLTIIVVLLNLIFIDSGITSAQTATLEPTLSLVDVNGIKIPYQNGFPLPTFENNPEL